MRNFFISKVIKMCYNSKIHFLWLNLCDNCYFTIYKSDGLLNYDSKTTIIHNLKYSNSFQIWEILSLVFKVWKCLTSCFEDAEIDMINNWIHQFINWVLDLIFLLSCRLFFWLFPLFRLPYEQKPIVHAEHLSIPFIINRILSSFVPV